MIDAIVQTLIDNDIQDLDRAIMASHADSIPWDPGGTLSSQAPWGPMDDGVAVGQWVLGARVDDGAAVINIGDRRLPTERIPIGAADGLPLIGPTMDDDTESTPPSPHCLMLDGASVATAITARWHGTDGESGWAGDFHSRLVPGAPSRRLTPLTLDGYPVSASSPRSVDQSTWIDTLGNNPGSNPEPRIPGGFDDGVAVISVGTTDPTKTLTQRCPSGVAAGPRINGPFSGDGVAVVPIATVTPHRATSSGPDSYRQRLLRTRSGTYHPGGP